MRPARLIIGTLRCSQTLVSSPIARPRLLPSNPLNTPYQCFQYHSNNINNGLGTYISNLVAKLTGKGAPQLSLEELDKMTSDQLYDIAAREFSIAEQQGDKTRVTAAISLIKQAREKGSALAAYSIAMLQLDPQRDRSLFDDEKSSPIDTMKKLADMGLAPALFVMGRWHMFGSSGFPKDLDKAIAFFESAAAKGDLQSPYNLYLLHQDRGNIEEAMKWLVEAANKNDTSAQYFLGNWYNMGNSKLKQDKTKAAEFWRLAAVKGHANAAHNLGLALLQGEGVEQNSQEAMKFLRLASDQGYLPSKMNLANIYIEGLAVPQDIETARILLAEVRSTTNKDFQTLRNQADELMVELEKKYRKKGY